MSHTPAPWWNDKGVIRKDIKDKGFPVAIVEDWGEETEHNANLIAAAPEMLNVLEKVHSFLENCDPFFSFELFIEVKEILNKAKNE